MNNELLGKLKKANAKNVDSVLYDDDDLFDPKWYTTTPIYSLNLALSGDIYGGFGPGIIFAAGKSRTFKTVLCLLMVKAYLDQHPNGVCLFYDFEGSPRSYWDKLEIDTDRVIKVEATDLENFKFDLVKKLTEIKKTDDVIIFVDSYGAIPSMKELEDAENQKSVADMSRAKSGKSLWRVTLPLLLKKRVPMIVINHVVASMDQYTPDEMGGGQGGILSANTIFYMGKRKVKETTGDETEKGLAGHQFVLNMGKSRAVKEGTTIPLKVLFGNNKPSNYTGLYNLALLTDTIFSPSKGYRSAREIDPETGELVPDDQLKRYREKEIEENPEFWEEVMFKKTNFINDVKKYVAL